MEDRFTKVEKLFNRALGIAWEARSAFLEQECGRDEALRLELEKLLDAAGMAEDFLEEPARIAFSALRREGEPDHSKELDDFVGQTLGSHHLLALIGTGGMGAVYKARSLTLGRPVAVKVLFKRHSFTQSSVRRFKREARAAAALNHPGIAQVYEYGEENGVPYIAMEYVEGRTLSSIIQESPLTADTAVEIATQVLAALKAAHQRGVVHRDIKSSNIVVRPDGVVKILDFGLAKVYDRGAAEPHLRGTSGSLTAAGTVMGTAAYMSPEQTRAGKVDPRSDLFSFGVVLYEAVTGLLPFQGRTPADTFDRIRHANPLPIARLNLAASQRLEEVIRKCLAKDPEDRYQSAAEVLAELRGEPAHKKSRRFWWIRWADFFRSSGWPR